MNDTRELSKFIIEQNKILKGSVYLKKQSDKAVNKDAYMIENMSTNLAFIEGLKGRKENKEVILKEFQERFKKYRDDWNKQPLNCIKNNDLGEGLKNKKIPPLCVDIEVAAICDLACPFCYREFIVTPDKIIDDKFCFDLIDQAAELKVPSIKFNWRGEPLLNPKIYDYINYAKKKGILETIINTNATNLTEENSSKLIKSGLDLIIYSFDGGTKETYEKMRPGRFKKNSFEKVYQNIKNFKKTRDKLNSKFPFTKIQMILTKDTIFEIDSFFKNFENYVDNVSCNQYTERGGDISDLTDLEKSKYKSLLKKYNLPMNTPYLKNIQGNISVSQGRLPCKQPYQRLLVTYEGKVGMCCYDWGAKHAIGYANKTALKSSQDYSNILDAIKKNKKGFELLKNAKMPEDYNVPNKKIESLKDIWEGKEVDKVREKHFKNQSEKISICEKCTFKDVYDWSD